MRRRLSCRAVICRLSVPRPGCVRPSDFASEGTGIVGLAEPICVVRSTPTRRQGNVRCGSKLGPRPTSELGPFIPQQRTCGDYGARSALCRYCCKSLFGVTNEI